MKYDRAGRTPALAPGVTMENGHALVRNVDAAESEIERTTVAAAPRELSAPRGRQNRLTRGRGVGEPGRRRRTAG